MLCDSLRVSHGRVYRTRTNNKHTVHCSIAKRDNKRDKIKPTRNSETRFDKLFTTERAFMRDVRVSHRSSRRTRRRDLAPADAVVRLSRCNVMLDVHHTYLGVRRVALVVPAVLDRGRGRLDRGPSQRQSGSGGRHQSGSLRCRGGAVAVDAGRRPLASGQRFRVQPEQLLKTRRDNGRDYHYRIVLFRPIV